MGVKGKDERTKGTWRFFVRASERPSSAVFIINRSNKKSGI
jgi:hypothetical protein